MAFCDEKIDIYVAKNLIPSHQHLDEDEFINVGAYTIDELRKRFIPVRLKIPRRWQHFSHMRTNMENSNLQTSVFT